MKVNEVRTIVNACMRRAHFAFFVPVNAGDKGTSSCPCA